MRGRWAAVVAMSLLVLILPGCIWLIEDTMTITPSEAAVHTLVTIRGQGFGDVQGTGSVSIWSLSAPIVSWSDTEIVCRVPMVPTPNGVPVETLIRVSSPEFGFYDDASFTVVRGILFASTREGKQQIHVMNPDGSGQTTLSQSLESDSGPAWYPNGSRVVFEASSPTNAPSLRIMNADGTGRAILTDNPLHEEEGPRWSLDGLTIVYASRIAQPQQLFTIHPDGSNNQQLTSFVPFGAFEPSWAPDATKLVFVMADGTADTDTRLVIRSVDKDDTQDLTASGNGDSTPAWSPDGEWIVFSRLRRSEGRKLMLIRPDGTDETELTGIDVQFATRPSWSPDGAAVVFQGYLDESPADIFLVDLESESITRLTNDPAVDADPFWFN